MYSAPSKVEINSSSLGFTVDWPHEKLYYCEEQLIMEYDMMSETTKRLYTTNTECADLAINPYNR